MSINIVDPSSIHKKQSECSEAQKRVNANRRRGWKITSKARDAKKLYSEVADYISADRLDGCTDDERQLFINLRSDLQRCGNHTLYRQYPSNGALEYICAQTCKNKLCPVCNYERSRQIRAKYYRYFKKNEIVDRKTGEVFKKSDFDFMHLTLTVPHTKKGFRGEEFYAQELMKEFNYMRKKPFWQKHVFAGEFGCEITKNDNGFHIHIHSLLLVRKSKQNRNKLYREIFRAWNMQTVDEFRLKTKFEKHEIEGIQKSFGYEKADEKEKSNIDFFIRQLNPAGATLIGLENLYCYNKKKLSKNDRWSKDRQKWKHYVNPKDENSLLAGILECIKYHFEPVCLNSDGVYDFDTLKEVLPKIYRKPLYRKFGAFHAVAELNVNSKIEEEIEEVMEEHGRDHTINPETFLPEKPQYIVVNAVSIWHDWKAKTYKPHISERCSKVHLISHNIRSCILEMLDKELNGSMDFKQSKEFQFSMN